MYRRCNQLTASVTAANAATITHRLESISPQFLIRHKSEKSGGKSAETRLPRRLNPSASAQTFTQTFPFHRFVSFLLNVNVIQKKRTGKKNNNNNKKFKFLKVGRHFTAVCNVSVCFSPLVPFVCPIGPAAKWPPNFQSGLALSTGSGELLISKASASLVVRAADGPIVACIRYKAALSVLLSYSFSLLLLLLLLLLVHLTLAFITICASSLVSVVLFYFYFIF